MEPMTEIGSKHDFCHVLRLDKGLVLEDLNDKAAYVRGSLMRDRFRYELLQRLIGNV